MIRPPRKSTLFPYTTLFRSVPPPLLFHASCNGTPVAWRSANSGRSEEHTSELQSRFDLVCRLLLEKKKKNRPSEHTTSAHDPLLSSRHLISSLVTIESASAC